MNIKQLIQNANREQDYTALAVYNKIIQISDAYHINYSQAIDKLLEIETTKYNINLLKLCKVVLKDSDILSHMQVQHKPNVNETYPSASVTLSETELKTQVKEEKLETIEEKSEVSAIANLKAKQQAKPRVLPKRNTEVKPSESEAEPATDKSSETAKTENSTK